MRVIIGFKSSAAQTEFCRNFILYSSMEESLKNTRGLTAEIVSLQCSFCDGGFFWHLMVARQVFLDRMAYGRGGERRDGN